MHQGFLDNLLHLYNNIDRVLGQPITPVYQQTAFYNIDSNNDSFRDIKVLMCNIIDTVFSQDV